MSNKEKIDKLEKEIRDIDVILYILLSLGLIESVLTFLGVLKLDILSLGIIIGIGILFLKQVKVRNRKDFTLRIYCAMELSEEEYKEKFKNK